MRWTKNQLQTLVDYYGTVPTKQLAEDIGVGINALRIQASRLGLTQPIVDKNDLDFSLREMRN